jgi:hypothetical protein
VSPSKTTVPADVPVRNASRSACAFVVKASAATPAPNASHRVIPCFREVMFLISSWLPVALL